MGPLQSGPRGGNDGLGQYKTPDVRKSVRDGRMASGGQEEPFSRLTLAV